MVVVIATVPAQAAVVALSAALEPVAAVDSL